MIIFKDVEQMIDVHLFRQLLLHYIHIITDLK